MSEQGSTGGFAAWKARKAAVRAENKQLVKEYWATAGFHRPLGGFWFNYALLLIIALPGILVIGVVLPAILPYPEALGFNNVTTSLLMPIYLFADFGIKEAVDRYIAQYSETEPRKAIKYAAFYLWYQAITGLVQVTVISFVAITVLPYTNFSYAVWFFLVYIMIQWPGTASMFQIMLDGFQQFDKSNVIVVIQNVAIQTSTQVVFILVGRHVGELYPHVGPLMGAVMGFIFGSYIDDIIAMLVGALLFRKVLEPFGLKLTDVLMVSFDKKIAKDVLLFGGKVLPSGLSYVTVNAIITFMVAAWLWNYSTLLGIYTIASGLISALGVSFSTAAPIAESYNNGKRELALYIIRAQFQWWGILSLGVLMAPLLFLIPDIVVLFAPQYAGVNWMIFPLFFGAFILFPSNFSGTICQACDKPQYSTFMNFIEQGTRVVAYFIALSPWTFRAWFGDDWATWAWLFAEAPGYTTKGFYGWYIVRKKVFPGMKIGFPAYQTLVAPLACMIPFALLYSLVMKPAFQATWVAVEGTDMEWFAYALAAIYLLLILFGFPIVFIMPLYGFTGAWDPQTLEDFRKAAAISGPSKFLVSLLQKMTAFGYRFSPFKGRFVIPSTEAMAQARAITEARKEVEQPASEHGTPGH